MRADGELDVVVIGAGPAGSTAAALLAASSPEGGVASCHFLRGRPELLTAGAADNSLRMWSSDLHSGELSALRGRAGHAASTRAASASDAAPTPK